MKRLVASRLSGLPWLAALALIILLAGCGQGASVGGSGVAGAAEGKPGVVAVDVLYLNHPPVTPILADIDKVVAGYGDRVKVTRYDDETPQGQDLAKARNVTGHVPLVIFINGSMEVKVDGRQVKFYSFPQGRSTFMAASGSWTMGDLDAALTQATGVKP